MLCRETETDNSGNGLSWSRAKKDIKYAINMVIGGDNVKVETATYFPATDASGNYSVKSGYMPNSGSGSANICNGQFYGNSVFGRNGAGIYYRCANWHNY